MTLKCSVENFIDVILSCHFVILSPGAPGKNLLNNIAKRFLSFSLFRRVAASSEAWRWFCRVILICFLQNNLKVDN